jgi:hypothetical protein
MIGRRLVFAALARNDETGLFCVLFIQLGFLLLAVNYYSGSARQFSVALSETAVAAAYILALTEYQSYIVYLIAGVAVLYLLATVVILGVCRCGCGRRRRKESPGAGAGLLENEDVSPPTSGRSGGGADPRAGAGQAGEKMLLLEDDIPTRPGTGSTDHDRVTEYAPDPPVRLPGAPAHAEP